MDQLMRIPPCRKSCIDYCVYFLVLVLYIFFGRYVPTCTIDRGELRNLQKIYSERTLEKDKECVARWIYRFASHLQLNVDQFLEPYVESS